MRKTASCRSWLRSRVTTVGALFGAAIFCVVPARAQDATWLLNPGSDDFNTGGNWDTGSAPTGTAFFDASSTTSLIFSADTSIGGWTFNANAGDYNFTNGQTLTFEGAGITINGGSATITNNSIIAFFNSSTAGSANITNNDRLEFINASTAGSATITNNSIIGFFDSSTASSATITNNN